MSDQPMSTLAPALRPADTARGLGRYRAGDTVFAGPVRSLHARGERARVAVEEWTGCAVAAKTDSLLRRAERAGMRNPIVVGAIPFDSSRPARLVVPAQFAWEFPAVRPGGARGIHGLRGIHAEADVDIAARSADLRRRATATDPAYLAGVATALGHIHRGEVGKVVLARSVRVPRGPGVPGDEDILHRLRAASPAGYTFAVPLLAAGETLIGATPELLISRDGERVRSQPFAGSLRRVSDPEADAAAARELAASAKDRVEHAYVVESIRSLLGEFTASLDVPDAPALVSTDRVWHLASTITGVLGRDVSVLELAYALHPTPAVGGTPVSRATRIIAECEPGSRGFYAGLVGWADARGNGEWAIALRCAVATAGEFTLSAGAGIVAESTPEGEHRETAAKLGTFLAALGEMSG